MAHNKQSNMHQGPKFGKPKNAIGTMTRLFRFLSGNLSLLIIALFLIIFSSVAGIIGTALLKPLINDLFQNIESLLDSGYSPDAAKAKILTDVSYTLFIMFGVYLAGALSTYFGNRILVSIAQSTTNKIRGNLFEHLQDLPVKYFDTHPHGELMSRFTNDIENVNMAFEQSLPQTVTSVITIVGTFIMMVIYSPLLTLFVVAMIFVMFKIVRFVGGKSATYFRGQQKALGELDGYIEEIMEGQKIVKVFNHEDKSLEEFAKKNDELRKASTSAQTFAGILMPIIGNLSYVQYAVTAAAGAVMIANPWNFSLFAHMDVGTLASFLQFTRSFSQPVANIANQTNTLLAALAGAERIFEVLDEKPEEDNGTTTLCYAVRNINNELELVDENTSKDIIPVWKTNTENGYILTEIKGDVRFNNIVFGYNPDKSVLKNLSLYAKPGQKIAFVGSTGAGKTTITNLINRFYEIQEGSITYDGTDIRTIKKSDLRKTLGIVLQDVHLFHGTIKDNIRYGKLNATDEEIIKSAKIANAHSFIKRLPEGYDTVLSSDGVNLSQGQRQLISIARAAIADPPVLILDEATSSIDTRTERLIEQGMDKLMHGRTTFVIAHRLSTVRNSNAIMVLENGEIIERGDHEDLLVLEGRYYRLYTGASELA